MIKPKYLKQPSKEVKKIRGDVIKLNINDLFYIKSLCEDCIYFELVRREVLK